MAAASSSSTTSLRGTATANGTMEDESTSALLVSTVDAYTSLSKLLFQTIEQPGLRPAPVSDHGAGRQWSPTSTTDILAALQDVDSLLSDRLELARRHARNQRRIEGLKRRAKQRDAATRQAILALDRMGEELDDIVKLGEDEVEAIDRAEKHPLQYDVLLAYAQRLSRYTAAPPGFRLPGLASSADTAQPTSAPEGATTAPSANGLDGDAPTLALGPDYNPLATRAAAYYDPAMPSMPQEMPFPSDALMRQGILNTQEMLAGASAALDPNAAGAGQGGDGDEELQDAEMAQHEEFIPSFAFQQKAEEEEEDEGFDLDLN